MAHHVLFINPQLKIKAARIGDPAERRFAPDAASHILLHKTPGERRPFVANIKNPSREDSSQKEKYK
jgi:hypothetical protein